MEIIQFEHLLQNVSTIDRKYKDILKVTGENFNVFQILNLSTSEVRTHSAFIAELLNPHGTHGMGDVFLKLFISTMTSAFDFNTDYVKVVVEKHIGYKNADATVGGRIDILISNTDSMAIIIENKIHAPDQEN